MNSSMYCPRCGNSVETEDARCPHCGLWLRCPECNAPLEEGEARCSQCGFSIPQQNEEKDAALSPESAPLLSIFPASNQQPPSPPEKEDHRMRRRLLVAVGIVLLVCVAWGAYSWLSGRAREEQAWEVARDSASLSALSAFMRDYPDGAHFRQADSLFRALRQADEAAWDRVKFATTPEAFRDYLAQYPQGIYAGRAAQLADSLDWAHAALLNTEEAYDAYLAAHPDGAYSDEARLKREDLENLKLTAEEETEIELTMEAYCRAVQNNDENALVSFFEPVIDLYFTKHNATKADVLLNQRELYNSGILNMMLVVNNNFTSSKDETGCYHTTFPVDLTYTHADSGEQTFKSLLIKAVLSPNLKIKMITSEEVSSLDEEEPQKGAAD